MIQYIIAAGIGAFLGSRSKKSKKSYAHGGYVKAWLKDGTKVQWYDPEEEYRDLDRVWVIKDYDGQLAEILKEEDYEDFLDDLIINIESEDGFSNAEVPYWEIKKSYAHGGMVNKIIGIARTQADSTDTETYVYPIRTDVPPKFYNEVGFKLENKDDTVKVIEMYFDTKEIALQGYDEEGENYEDIKVYKLDSLSEDFQNWIARNLIMKSRREKGKTKYAKGGKTRKKVKK